MSAKKEMLAAGAGGLALFSVFSHAVLAPKYTTITKDRDANGECVATVDAAWTGVHAGAASSKMSPLKAEIFNSKLSPVSWIIGTGEVTRFDHC